MDTQIYVNIPVKDLSRSVKFFTALGFKFNSQFTDDKATCMIVSDDIFVMLLSENFFKTFTKKEINDTTKTSEVILCLSAESREKVDEMVNKAVKAGGTAPMEKQDHGWMYSYGFQDPDGHLWEIIFMDESAMPKE